MIGEPIEHVLELGLPYESGYSSRRGKELTQVQYTGKENHHNYLKLSEAARPSGCLTFNLISGIKL